MAEYICKFEEEYGFLKADSMEIGDELIRCKDCMKNLLCIMFRSSKNPEGYCCWAEKREE